MDSLMIPHGLPCRSPVDSLRLGIPFPMGSMWIPYDFPIGFGVGSLWIPYGFPINP